MVVAPPTSGSTSSSCTYAVEAAGISRAFGGVQALRDASFQARPGEIHALAGENGAGKSTMIKVLCGLIKPDRGSVHILGEQITSSGPAAMLRLGVATAFQELSLMPDLTVAENLLLRDPPRGRFGLVRRRDLATRATELMAALGVENIDPVAVVDQLSVAERQVVELIRVLSGQPRVLILDEPTAALPDRQVDWLGGHIRRLRASGTCVIFTSHRWREIEDLADRVTVFRNGTHVQTRESLSEQEAVKLMSGRSLDRQFPDVADSVRPEVALDVSALAAGRVKNVSFQLHSGEILGVGGLAGQGQSDLFLALFGARRCRAGEIRRGGVALRLRRPQDAIRQGVGIAYVPEDRKSEGLLLPLPVRENLTLAVLRDVAAGGFIRRRRERELVEAVIAQLDIDTRRPDKQLTGTLSGGNQQKVLMGRWLLADADVLLLFDVTRGVDAATKHDIYKLIVDLARQGKAILLYSSETEEIARLCHRVLVMRDGQVSESFEGPVGDAERIVGASLRELPSV